MRTRFPIKVVSVPNGLLPEDLFSRFDLEPVENPTGLHLVLEKDGMRLTGDNGIKFSGPPLSDKKFLARVLNAQRHNEPLIRAVKKRDEPALNILDTTAGFGRDAIILAAAGHSVTAIEYHPAIASLTWMAFFMLHDPRMSAIKNKITLAYGNGNVWLNGDKEFDVIYADPMFALKTSAKPKLYMQAIQALQKGYETPSLSLDKMIACAHRRVVVKRARKSPFFSGKKPHHQIVEGDIRFDVYSGLADGKHINTSHP